MFVPERGSCRAAQAKLGVQKALRKAPLSPRHGHVTYTASAAPSAPALLPAFLVMEHMYFFKKALKAEGRMGCQCQALARQSRNTLSIALYKRCRHCII